MWDEGPLIGDLEGHSILDDVRDYAGRIQAGWMGMFVIADVIALVYNRFRTLLSPDLWRPQSRVWCVATRIGIRSSDRRSGQ